MWIYDHLFFLCFKVFERLQSALSFRTKGDAAFAGTLMVSFFQGTNVLALIGRYEKHLFWVPLVFFSVVNGIYFFASKRYLKIDSTHSRKSFFIPTMICILYIMVSIAVFVIRNDPG